MKCFGTDEDEDVCDAVIDFEQKPFSVHSDSVQNGLDAIQWLINPYDITQFFKFVAIYILKLAYRSLFKFSRLVQNILEWCSRRKRFVSVVITQVTTAIYSVQQNLSTFCERFVCYNLIINISDC